MGTFTSSTCYSAGSGDDWEVPNQSALIITKSKKGDWLGEIARLGRPKNELIHKDADKKNACKLYDAKRRLERQGLTRDRLEIEAGYARNFYLADTLSVTVHDFFGAQNPQMIPPLYFIAIVVLFLAVISIIAVVVFFPFPRFFL